MFQNYLKIALRNLRRYKAYTFINVFGLALGVAVCVLILLYVRDELTYDHFHERADRTYVAGLKRFFGDGSSFLMGNPPVPLGAALVASTPEVEAVAHLHDPGRVVVTRGAERFYEEGLRYADPAFLDVFHFPLQRGDAATALARPGTVLVTPEAAERYFGAADPVGQMLQVGPLQTVEVVGVLRPLPSNTSLTFDLLASLETLRADTTDPATNLDAWHMAGSTRSFIVLRAGADTSTVARQMTALMTREQADLGTYQPILEPLKHQHLHGFNAVREGTLSGNVRYVYIFGCIALLVLLIACINFTNLTTAQALRRAREVGVRKVVGAGRAQLVGQFLGETFLYSLVAVLAAVALVELALPGFSGLVGKVLRVDYAGPRSLVPWLALLWAGTGLLAGLYPAFVLSGFSPMTTLKGAAARGTRGSVLRRALVVLQFTISIALLAGLFVIQRQLDHLQRQSLAMQPDQVLLLGAYEQAGANYAAFKRELQQLPGVTHVSLSNFPRAFGLPAKIEGQEQQTYLSTLLGDADFLRTLNLQPVRGRALDPEKPADFDGAVLVNEAAAKEFGWDDPLGKRIERYGLQKKDMVTSEVVGVLADFPTNSLKHAIGPLQVVLTEDASFFGDDMNVLVRLQAGRMDEALAALQALWPRFAPAHPFEYTFLDERFGEYYRAERQLGLLFGTFAGLAVLIACLGLFGLAVYTAERRTKEIGIRKVMGASVPDVVVLLSREFAVLVLASFVLATPLAYFAMNRWLQDFAYRVEMGPGLFALAGGIALGVALVTVSYQAFRAALADPVKALRYE